MVPSTVFSWKATYDIYKPPAARTNELQISRFVILYFGEIYSPLSFDEKKVAERNVDEIECVCLRMN